MTTPTASSSQPHAPARKHGKKKSRTSWKAGFNSTPSSPSQSIESRPSALNSLNHFNSSKPYISKINMIPDPIGSDQVLRNRAGVSVFGNRGKENTPPLANTSNSLPGNAGSKENEFLQNLDKQLSKLDKGRLENDEGDSKDSEIPSKSGIGSSSHRDIPLPSMSLYSAQGDIRLKAMLGSIMSESSTVSLWDYLKEELTAADFETTQELKRERVANFLSVPIAFEKIFDRLCCSFGQDILDSLFSKSTLGSNPSTASRHARPLTFVVLAVLYILAHTMVLFFQMVTLNVAVNSYSNALLTLLISNQFVEIKGSVFKKFEKENLFQLSCSDIVERFQLSVFVTIITIRNLVELSAAPPSPFSVYPQSFVPLFSSMTAMARLLTPCFLVLGCETLVDWLKHAFITKFNQIRPSVYGRFVDILSRDLVVGSPARLAGNKHQQMFVDQSPMVSRRIGLAALPLACLVICVTIQTLQMVLSTLPSDPGRVLVVETAASVHLDPWVFEWPTLTIDTSGFSVAMCSMVGFLLQLCRICWTVLGQGWAANSRMLLIWIHRGNSPGLVRQVVDVAVICLTCVATYACLVAMKLLIGINLLGFAHHRYTTMESREQVERQTDRQMRESNAAQEEKAASVVVSGMLDGRMGHPNGDSFGAGGEKRALAGLDTIERYSLYKSRIP
ncbi:hypothetical protein BGZ82_004567 [Podila clonocystis]|nr:hypothetical protein BGZ82_004567 [Podila clonocystis]